MNILVISTNVFPLPPSGYSGLEHLVYQWSCIFARSGHRVTVVAPEGSRFPDGLDIELIATQRNESEEVSWLRYKDDLVKGKWDAVFDNSWMWYTVLSQMESDHQLPVIHIYHSDAANLAHTSPPSIQYPCIVSLSNSQGQLISNVWRVMTRTCYNGIDLSFYRPNPEVQRSNRYLFMGRYTPEKSVLEATFLAKKCRVPLDLYGDTQIIASQDYLSKVMQECDQRQIVFHQGISREETVKQYQSHKALIHLVNYNEAFGLVPVEAMATGLPVIVNRRGALPELVKHGKTGFVVDTLEEAEEIIKKDLVSSINPEDCIKQARRFSIEKSAMCHLRFLQDVADGVYW